MKIHKSLALVMTFVLVIGAVYCHAGEPDKSVADTEAGQKIAAFKAQYDKIVAMIEQQEMAEYEAMPKLIYADKFSATFRSKHGIELQTAVWGKKDAGTYPEDTATGKVLNELWRRCVEEYPKWKAGYKKASNSDAMKKLKKEYDDDCARAKLKHKRTIKGSLREMSDPSKKAEWEKAVRKDAAETLRKDMENNKRRYKNGKMFTMKRSGGLDFKKKMDGLENDVKELIQEEKKLRDKEILGTRRVKALAIRRIQTRLNKLRQQPGVQLRRVDGVAAVYLVLCQ